jgi:hypothetical protein
VLRIYPRSLSGLSGKFNQKNINYAKQSQFPKKSNVYNRSFNNELQRKMNNGHLVKTNPNKANFIRIETLRVFVEDDGLGWAEEFIAYASPANSSAEGR